MEAHVGGVNTGCDRGFGAHPPLSCVHTSPVGCLMWAESRARERRASAGAGSSTTTSSRTASLSWALWRKVGHQSGIRPVLARALPSGHSACLGTAFLLGLSPRSLSDPFSHPSHHILRTPQDSALTSCCAKIFPILLTSCLFYYFFSIYLLYTMHIYWMSEIYYNVKSPIMFIVLF